MHTQINFKYTVVHERISYIYHRIKHMIQPSTITIYFLRYTNMQLFIYEDQMSPEFIPRLKALPGKALQDLLIFGFSQNGRIKKYFPCRLLL